MDGIDKSLDEIIKLNKGQREKIVKPLITPKINKPGRITKSSSFFFPQRKREAAVFTESYKALHGPIKEIFTSGYIPLTGPITLCAVNTELIQARRAGNPTSAEATFIDHNLAHKEGNTSRKVSVSRPNNHDAPDLHHIKREPSPEQTSILEQELQVSTAMDTDESVLMFRGRAPAPGGEVDQSDDNGPTTIEMENLDPETTAEDVKVVCSRFGEIRSCVCSNGYSQVTYARRAAATAAVENLNGKKADKDLVLRVRLRKHPIFHDVPVIPSPHMPGPIAGPLKLLTQAVKGTIANAGTIYADQVLAAQQMLKVQQHRMAHLQMEEQRIAALRMQANAHLAKLHHSHFPDPSRNPSFMAYSTITDRTSGKSVATILQNIVNGNVIVDYTDRRPTVDALMHDLKEGGVARNWHERERILALQALKTLGRATEGCDSIFTEEGIRTLLYHSGLHKATEASIDRTSSREALKCLANALLLKPTTRPIFERLDGHGQCSALLKRSHLSNESQFLFSRILFLVTIDATSIVKSLLDEHHAVNNVGMVLKTQLARTPDGTMFSQSMVLSEALKYLFNLMIVDPKIERDAEANFSEKEKTEATGKRFQSLLPTIVSILITIPPPSPNPLEPPHSHAIHVLLNFPISTSALLVTRSQQATLLSVLLQILDDTLRHSLNTDEEASTDGLSNGTELDEIVPPLVLVLTNIASAGGEGRAALKARMLPEDVDRTKPLDKGNTFSARLIRRMTSMRFPQIRETVSQLLFVLCDEDPALLTRHVGYGNAAGFLMNRNLGVPSSVSGAGSDEASSEVTELPSPGPASENSPPLASTFTAAAGKTKPPSPTPNPAPSMSSSRRYSSASAVNPITGAYYPDPSAIRTAMADMTEEEKEEEASKLLDMFDKLRRTGVMDVRNPALEAGLRQRERDRYYDEQEMREQAEEEELERTYGKV
ncbi:hypothetical protein KVV02_001366 [Mortierella alpina]|uniref:RRM domain-containing protein n=1 Tax=Mortierella alpina TaxID=64518 RepID=A0A9P8A0R7_MORAP|nr:hypothetical protein KVV02_001366 [Mortierella alpina]